MIKNFNNDIRSGPFTIPDEDVKEIIDDGTSEVNLSLLLSYNIIYH